ncbi:hypothetical protein [Marinilabilia rubra]|uniref:Uncharacterized protein n=1 Tax=Marinilabilia rubra TaxID=2162893 RepID=A0A2U2B905_9BACT|nr:hypothetical protein [Marinilabilia rubra]PWD99545.1 hypothetical protein DDZ16_08805 [Marinilabilia rubra]
MEKSIEKKRKVFKGAGYLLGFLIGTLVAVIFVVITGVEALIGAIAGAVAVPSGMFLDKKLQNQSDTSQTADKSVFLVLLIVGIMFLGFIVFLIH